MMDTTSTPIPSDATYSSEGTTSHRGPSSQIPHCDLDLCVAKQQVDHSKIPSSLIDWGSSSFASANAYQTATDRSRYWRSTNRAYWRAVELFLRPRARANERQPDVLASLVGQRLPLKAMFWGEIRSVMMPTRSRPSSATKPHITLCHDLKCGEPKRVWIDIINLWPACVKRAVPKMCNRPY